MQESVRIDGVPIVDALRFAEEEGYRIAPVWSDGKSPFSGDDPSYIEFWPEAELGKRDRLCDLRIKEVLAGLSPDEEKELVRLHGERRPC